LKPDRRLNLSRSSAFVLILVAAFLLPAAIPTVGIDYPYFFIFVIVLFAWFLIKWDSVKAMEHKSSIAEMILGAGVIGADYAQNAFRGSNVGLIDLMVIFLASIILVYGLKSMARFWVPVAYGIVLLAGYQIENVLPNYVALQDWLAGVMVGSLRALGIGAAVSGHLVTMNLANGTPVALDVASDCTGLQGILAFGMLSTMALLDMKPKMSRLVPIFAAGFLGAFLINIVRLIVVFLTFEYFGISAGSTMHVYFGYIIFIFWVLAFWMIAFKYLGPARGVLPQQATLVPKLPS
jgi:exosortase/archaeosortase family protein